MKLSALSRAAFVIAAATSLAAFAMDDSPVAAPTDDTLFETIAALDTAVFDAFNRCSAPEELRRHAAFFAPDVEFYHDTGGVTWTRDAMLANTEKHACGNYRRELVAGSLTVYPIRDFGAISQGSHRFCQTTTGVCDGLAEFTMVWHRVDDTWTITRVLSYGHRANE